MIKISIIHYQPIEFYPPVLNLLDIASKSDAFQTNVYSTYNNKNRKKYKNDKVSTIYRGRPIELNDSILKRFFKYLQFNFDCLMGLVKNRPDKIIYFESYSVGPVYWFYRLFSGKSELFIHYHEYCGVEWYRQRNWLMRKYHKYEQQYLYPKARWISQTNSDRIRLFLNDNSSLSKTKMYELPNFPPISWQKTLNEANCNLGFDVLKTAYVGSLSIESTYVKEFCEWVISQEGKVSFDIYSYNQDLETRKFLWNLNSKFINFYDNGAEYNELPKLLRRYHVGLIFYKVNSNNVKYCAPNKFFEYLTSGLNVWLTDKMLGLKKYESPQVLGVDFSKLNTFTIPKEAFVRRPMNNSTFNAENALSKLLRCLAE